jgi:hypothetical protein
MNHSRAKRGRRIPGPAVIGLLVGLLFLGAACKSPVTPKDGEADIIIVNDYGVALNIFMNGEYLYPLNHNQSVEIDNLKFGVYNFEARVIDTDEIVASKEVDVTSRDDYTWLIDDPPDINVINDLATDLNIYLDGEFQFLLLDEENRWILDVSFGEHFLSAVRAADGRELASVTVTVEDATDYEWTIKEIE